LDDEAQQTATDFSRIVDHALAQRKAGQGALTNNLGLSGAQISALRDRWLPARVLPDLDLPAPPLPDDQHAIATLVLWRGGAASDEARWLAAILARRAMEASHLWEDLGLANRQALSEMIARHLPGLAKSNHLNMRWKKFFYRQICSDAAFSLCLAPSCDACAEKPNCFAPED
jgi:nitrogen fixation protein NifQ